MSSGGGILQPKSKTLSRSRWRPPTPSKGIALLSAAAVVCLLISSWQFNWPPKHLRWSIYGFVSTVGLTAIAASAFPKLRADRRATLAGASWLLLLALIFFSDLPPYGAGSESVWSQYALTTGALTSILVLGVGFLTWDLKAQQNAQDRNQRLRELAFRSIDSDLTRLWNALVPLWASHGKVERQEYEDRITALSGACHALASELRGWRNLLGALDDDRAAEAVEILTLQLLRVTTALRALERHSRLVIDSSETEFRIVDETLISQTLGLFHTSKSHEERVAFYNARGIDVATGEWRERLLKERPLFFSGSFERDVYCSLSDVGAGHELLRYVLDVCDHEMVERLSRGLTLLSALHAPLKAPVLFERFGTFREGLAFLPGRGSMDPTHPQSRPHMPMHSEWPTLLRERREFLERHRTFISAIPLVAEQELVEQGLSKTWNVAISPEQETNTEDTLLMPLTEFEGWVRSDTNNPISHLVDE